MNSPSLQLHSSFPWATLQNERLAHKRLCQALVLGRARLSASCDRAPDSPYQWIAAGRLPRKVRLCSGIEKIGSTL